MWPHLLFCGDNALGTFNLTVACPTDWMIGYMFDNNTVKAGIY
jgi:hypothetical protein